MRQAVWAPLYMGGNLEERGVCEREREKERENEILLSSVAGLLSFHT